MMSWGKKPSWAILWCLKHKDEQSKLSRYILKLYELPISFVCCHVAGKTNGVADFLSRMYYVPENKKKGDLHYKAAQHIERIFKPMEVVTLEEIIQALGKPEVVTPCKDKWPEMCHLNVNSPAYKGLGKLTGDAEKNYQVHILNRKLLRLTLEPKELVKELSEENILKEQRKDYKMMLIIENLDMDPDVFYPTSQGATPRPRPPLSDPEMISVRSGMISAVAASRPKQPAIIMSPKGVAEYGWRDF